jgi:Holliday junction resolvasome RuvABC DNA-binding subunit
MNRLSVKQRTSAIACLVEGNSQRTTCRMTGLAKKTVSRLAVELGQAWEIKRIKARIAKRHRAATEEEHSER